MRKVVMFNRVSLDGYFSGPNGEIDWFIHDPEVDQAAHEMMNPNTVLFGRITYQMFENYWPHVLENPSASKGEQVMAEELNQMSKLVFSKTLKMVNWANTMLVNDDLTREVSMLRMGKGPDMVIFGSGTIVKQLTNAGLLDEYIMVVTPVILGSGKNLFRDSDKIKLQLIQARQFKSGNALLHYKVTH